MLLAGLEQHPHLQADTQRVAVAQTDVALAEQDYRPDWAVTVSLGYRPAFSEMGTVQFEVPLPWFTARRQDPRLAAALSAVDAQAAQREDRLREHAAHIRGFSAELQHLLARLARYDDSVLPAAEARVKAATAAYAAGDAALSRVLDARAGALAVAMDRLNLYAQAADRHMQLQYFAHAAVPASAHQPTEGVQP